MRDIRRKSAIYTLYCLSYEPPRSTGQSPDTLQQKRVVFTLKLELFIGRMFDLQGLRHAISEEKPSSYPCFVRVHTVSRNGALIFLESCKSPRRRITAIRSRDLINSPTRFHTISKGDSHDFSH